MEPVHSKQTASADELKARRGGCEGLPWVDLRNSRKSWRNGLGELVSFGNGTILGEALVSPCTGESRTADSVTTVDESISLRYPIEFSHSDDTTTVEADFLCGFILLRWEKQIVGSSWARRKCYLLRSTTIRIASSEANNCSRIFDDIVWLLCAKFQNDSPSPVGNICTLKITKLHCIDKFTMRIGWRVSLFLDGRGERNFSVTRFRHPEFDCYNLSVTEVKFVLY